MRSTRVDRVSDSQCRSRNCPGFDPSILRHSGIWAAADEAVMNIVHKREEIPKSPPLKNVSYSVTIISSFYNTVKKWIDLNQPCLRMANTKGLFCTASSIVFHTSFPKRYRKNHEENIKEENNDNVVFKRKISTNPLGKRVVIRGKGSFVMFMLLTFLIVRVSMFLGEVSMLFKMWFASIF